MRARSVSAHDLVRDLRQYRASAGLTQQKLATLAGMSVGALRDLEQGRTARPSQRTLDQLATILGLGPGERDDLLAAQSEQPLGANRDPALRSAQGGELRLGILGPLAVWRDGSPVVLGGTRQRAVLGVLALHNADGVHRDTIVDLLWGEDPPASAVAIVHSQVSQLRRLLEPDRPARASRILVSERARYCLHPRVLSDADEFTARLEQADDIASAGDLASACTGYAAALALWRGEVLADLEVLRAYPAAVELGWTWASAIMSYAEAALTAGCADRVIRHLRGLTVREPLNEKAHALLLRALTATGQRAAALDLFEGTRRRLADELGASPGPDLAEAHLQALREPAPGTPAAEGAGSGRPGAAAGGPRDRPSRSAPRQLPPATPYFAGRSAELDVLTAVADQRANAGATVVTIAIDGTAGVGKTALAVQWAHQMADRFPDGQLYVNLRGYGPIGMPLDAAVAIRQLLEDLGIAPERIPVDLDERTGLYRRLLASQRVAIVLDNARDPDQVRPLLPGSPGCLAVVTSRRQLTGLSVADGAYLLSLDLFSEEDARELLERRLGAGRISAETEAVSEVIRLCGRLPLSLSIAAARAAARPSQPLAAQAAKLRNAQTRLDGLSTGDVTTDLRAVFSWSYQQVSPTAAQLFRLIGVQPGPDFTVAAAASLAGIPPNQAEQALAELEQAHLLAEPAPGRHACHDLLRDYAGEQALVHETPETRQAAIRRLLDFYLHTTCTASRLLHPYRDLITIEDILPSVEPEPLADRQQALKWFRAERPVLLAAIETAAQAGLDRHAWQLSWTMATFLGWQGHWHELIRSQQTALAAARRLGDLSAQATALHYVGQTQFRLGMAEAADAHQREALDLGRQLDSGIIQGRALLELARTADYQDRRNDAVTYAEQSLPHFQAAASPSWAADALNAAAWYRAQLGDHLQALAYCEKALDAQRELGNHIGEAATLDTLGYIHQHLGHHDQAIACYHEAIKAQGDTLIAAERATVLVHLGDACQAAGEVIQAGSAWRQALSILQDMGDPGADEVRRKLQDAGLPPEPRP